MEENNQPKKFRKFKIKHIRYFHMIIIICVLFVWIFVGKNIFLDHDKKDWFTNPILDTNIGQSVMENKNINLEDYFQDYEKAKIANWDITQLSIYFRNLNNGNRFWIEEKELFSPASLMKLPLLIAYFKKSEKEPEFLEKKLKFTKNWTSNEYKQNVVPKKRLDVWKEYKIIDIIHQMIEYSDNEASIFLEKNIDTNEFMNVFTDIWIQFPPITDEGFDNNIRVVDYSAFFRVLFNASYLNRENSEKVLNLLTKTDFKDGLVAGVNDKNIAISHKFWERSIFWNNWIERMQLHDCWIVYYPKYPYLLCIMTRWYDWNNLKEVLQEVSSIIYQKVDESYSK